LPSCEGFGLLRTSKFASFPVRLNGVVLQVDSSTVANALMYTILDHQVSRTLAFAIVFNVHLSAAQTPTSSLGSVEEAPACAVSAGFPSFLSTILTNTQTECLVQTINQTVDFQQDVQLCQHQKLRRAVEICVTHDCNVTEIFSKFPGLIGGWRDEFLCFDIGF
jgi:hypothetical protein